MKNQKKIQVKTTTSKKPKKVVEEKILDEKVVEETVVEEAALEEKAVEEIIEDSIINKEKIRIYEGFKKYLKDSKKTLKFTIPATTIGLLVGLTVMALIKKNTEKTDDNTPKVEAVSNNNSNIKPYQNTIVLSPAPVMNEKTEDFTNVQSEQIDVLATIPTIVSDATSKYSNYTNGSYLKTIESVTFFANATRIFEENRIDEFLPENTMDLKENYLSVKDEIINSYYYDYYQKQSYDMPNPTDKASLLKLSDLIVNSEVNATSLKIIKWFENELDILLANPFSASQRKANDEEKKAINNIQTAILTNSVTLAGTEYSLDAMDMNMKNIMMQGMVAGTIHALHDCAGCVSDESYKAMFEFIDACDNNIFKDATFCGYSLVK